MNRGYQHDFSAILPSMYDVRSRERKAATMVAVLKDFYEDSHTLADLSVLDVGASTGIIDHYLAGHLGRVVGVDIDSSALLFARREYACQNLDFVAGDAMKLPFADRVFDIVICSQVYEHVPDAQRMLDEIYRVLKPSGICYFSAGNRLNVMEPHYKLPLLSVIPKPLAHLYMRLAGKGKFYYEEHATYWQLKQMTKNFIRHDYTVRMVRNPHAFGMGYMLNPQSLAGKLAILCAEHFYWAFPNYIWLLQKPESSFTAPV